MFAFANAPPVSASTSTLDAMTEARNDDQEHEATPGIRQIEDVTLYGIGSRLMDLGEQLRKVGSHAHSGKLRGLEELADLSGEDEHHREVSQLRSEALRRTLTDLAHFRKDYATWERLIVEYALQSGMTQRDAARHLGVGLSTVNRWAQHPLTYED